MAQGVSHSDVGRFQVPRPDDGVEHLAGAAKYSIGAHTSLEEDPSDNVTQQNLCMRAHAAAGAAALDVSVGVGCT